MIGIARDVSNIQLFLLIKASSRSPRSSDADAADQLGLRALMSA